MLGGGGPDSCGLDCAHLWTEYAEGCAAYLGTHQPGFQAFTALCETTVTSMAILEADGTLEEGGHDDYNFTATQGVVYQIWETPGITLRRTGLAIEAPHSHHILANRIDISKHGAGAHTIEWDAAETEAGVDVDVDRLGKWHP